MNAYTLLADLVVVAHMAYMAFVVLGLLAILAGFVFHWQWVRNKWFRMAHLATIGIVVYESLLSITCPLTDLEDYLRIKGGQSISERSFVGRLVHDLLFYDMPPQFFTAAYCIFGSLVLATLFVVPVRWKHT